MSDAILWETRGHVGVATIDRPEQRNALSADLCRQLHAHLDAEPGLRAVVITGSGDKAFCAGADLGRAHGRDRVGERRQLQPAVRGAARRDRGVPGAGDRGRERARDRRGHAARGGVRRPRRRTRTRPSASPRGSSACSFAREHRPARRRSSARARRATSCSPPAPTTSTTPPRSASCSGAPTTRSRPRSSSPSEIAALAPLTVQGSKRALNLVAGALDDTTRTELRALQDRAFGSDDLREGLAAFAEKRAPTFEGR